jgi:hypothetical protein
LKKKLIEIIEKNSKVERASYEAINLYLLMIFDNYTIDEINNYMIQFEEKKIDNSTSYIFNYFYNNLYYLFDLAKEKKDTYSLYKTFEDITEFKCSNIYNSVQYETLEEVCKQLTEKNIKQKLIAICIKSGITQPSNDINTIFERHFQYIKNGMLSLKDFSFEGINQNLNNALAGKISFFFLTTTIYIFELTVTKPHIDSIKKISKILTNTFLFMEIIFIIFGIALILINYYFFFYKINEFCKQVFLLIEVFNIYKIYE